MTRLIIAIGISLMHLCTAEWPFTRCSTTGPNVDLCMLKAALQSTKTIFKGKDKSNDVVQRLVRIADPDEHRIPIAQLPPLDPIKMGNKVFSVESGPLSLEIDFENAVLTGVSHVRIDSAKYHKDLHRLDLEGLHEEITMTAKYNMKGKILFFSVNSEGTAVLTFKNAQALHSFEFTPLNGKQSLSANPKQKTMVRAFPTLKSMGVMNIKVATTNLGTTGTRMLNSILNANWKILYEAFKSEIEKWLENVYTEQMASFFRLFNFDEIFPQTA